MIRAIFMILALLAAAPLWASDAADQASLAASELQAAVAAMESAENGPDQVAALTRTIKAYEIGLAAMREALRQMELRDAGLTAALTAKRDRQAQLLAVLERIEAQAGPMQLLHPNGPLGTVMAGMLLADVTPALQKEADLLRGDLAELQEIRALQTEAGRILARGLAAAQKARSGLSQAISERTELPKRFTEDPQMLLELLESADTLASFAEGLTLDDRQTTAFSDAKGKLDLPVLGALLLGPGETDASGVTRPGLTLATRPAALVTSPWPATIRFRGPLLDYGNVMIIEPGSGYLMIMAGLDQVYGEVGDVVGINAPLGMMRADAPPLDGVAMPPIGGGAGDTETLYLELRQGAEPVDPMAWFKATAEAGE